MTTWNRALREGAVAGSIASLLSTGYLAWAGRRHGDAAAPVNAVSHWIFGDPALREDGTSAKFTATGALIHHGASVFWGVLHAKYWGGHPRAKRPLPAAAGAVAAAGIACFVDYRLTPGRLTPGFEHRLSTREMFNEYAWVAVGLAIGSMLMREGKRLPPPRR
ncbi:MAG TPA: hypothetical protein VIL30_05040 [Ramlibacter sp.]|jgi:hypothetical protein